MKIFGFGHWINNEAYYAFKLKKLKLKNQSRKEKKLERENLKKAKEAKKREKLIHKYL